MRIAQICPYAWDAPGGVQVHVRQLSSHLRERGHEVVVLAPSLRPVREDGVRLDRPLLDVVHIVLDATEDWVGALSENRTPPDTGRALRAIESALGMESVAPEIQTESSLPARPFRKFETVRVNTETLDRLLRSMGQLVAEILRQEVVTKQLRDINKEVGDLEKDTAHDRHGLDRRRGIYHGDQRSGRLGGREAGPPRPRRWLLDG